MIFSFFEKIFFCIIIFHRNVFFLERGERRGFHEWKPSRNRSCDCDGAGICQCHRILIFSLYLGSERRKKMEEGKKKERRSAVNVLIIFQYVLVAVAILFTVRALFGVARYGVLACLAIPEMRAALLAATLILFVVGGFILYSNGKIREAEVFDYGRYLDAFAEMDARRMEMESFKNSVASSHPVSPKPKGKKGKKKGVDPNAPFKK